MSLWYRAFAYCSRRRLTDWIPDELYLKIMYLGIMGKHLNLKNPKTFSEKMQWLKLHNRKPEYSLMVDKYEAKQYVEKMIGGGIQSQTLVYGIPSMRSISINCLNNLS